MQLQVENADGRIRNFGLQPWASESNYPDTSIVEVGDQGTPDGDLRDYRYMGGEFISDPLPPTAATVRRVETQTRFQQLTQGLGGLTVEDRSYAITARIMAHKDGATNAVLLGITNKATAQAYVTGKSEWIGATAATRALVGDVLETMAGIVQVALLTLE